MISSNQAITACRAKALTRRQTSHLTYVNNLEAEIEARILAEEYRAAIDVRDEYAESFSAYWRRLGYSVTESASDRGYITVTVGWGCPSPGQCVDPGCPACYAAGGGES